MSRIRYLKPEFFEDEHLTEHPFWIRLLFAGLWNIADKSGRLEDRPKRIKVKVFPYDNVNIEKGLNELSKIKNNSKRSFIIRYKIEGEGYIQIVNWDKHQKPHHTEKKSVIPAPPKNILSLKGMVNGDGDGECSQSKLEEGNGELTVKKRLKDIKLICINILHYFNLKTGKNYTLTDERKNLINTNLNKGRTEEQIKKAIDNFSKDDWEGRSRYMDLVYCIGVRNKIDNFEKWSEGSGKLSVAEKVKRGLIKLED